AAVKVKTPQTTSSQPRSDFPEVRKQSRPDRGLKIRGAAGSAGSGLRTNRPLDHLHMTIAPLLHALIEVDEALADLRVLGVGAVDAQEDRLDALRTLA